MYFFDDIPQLIEIVKKNVITVHLLVDEKVYNSLISKNMVKLNAIDISYTIRKVRDVIIFFKEYHEYEGPVEDIYNLLFKLEKSNTRVIGLLRASLFSYIEEAYKAILNKEEIFLSDIVDLYDMIPIYTKDFKGQSRVRKV